MNREARIGVAVVAALGAFVALMLIIGSLGPPRSGAAPVAVGDVLAEPVPRDRWGSRELSIMGWYAELDANCRGDDGGADESVAWLQRECPLRVLLSDQPAEDVTQAELERDGIRLVAPLDDRFPSRAEPGGPNVRPVQLVFVGHFGDEMASRCVPGRRERCERTFVVTDYDELVR